MNAEISTRLQQELELRLQGRQPYLYGWRVREVLDQAGLPQSIDAVAKINHQNYIAVPGPENSAAIDRLLLRRIIRNHYVGYQKLSREQDFFDQVFHHFGFNSDAWVRKLMADQSMISLMHSSNYPFSLLAELK